MKTVRVYQLTHLAPMLFQRLKETQMEAARVWNECMQTHKQARLGQSKWPGEQDLRDRVKGRFALHSQSIQAIVRMFVTNIATTRKLRKDHPQMRMSLAKSPRNRLDARSILADGRRCNAPSTSNAAGLNDVSEICAIKPAGR